jgi:hypothetical protein
MAKVIKLKLQIGNTDPVVSNILTGGEISAQGPTATAALNALKTQVETQVATASTNAQNLQEGLDALNQ